MLSDVLIDVVIVVYCEYSSSRLSVFVSLACVALSIDMHLSFCDDLCSLLKTLHRDIRVIHLSLLEVRMTIVRVKTWLLYFVHLVYLYLSDLESYPLRRILRKCNFHHYYVV